MKHSLDELATEAELCRDEGYDTLQRIRARVGDDAVAHRAYRVSRRTEMHRIMAWLARHEDLVRDMFRKTEAAE